MGLKRMTSTSAQSVSSITLEFEEDSNPIQALDDVRQQVDEFTNLPGRGRGASGHPAWSATNPWPGCWCPARWTAVNCGRLAYRFEDELLQRGIDRVSIRGLPEQQISIDVPIERLETLGLSLDQIAERVGAISRDLPAGMMASAGCHPGVAGGGTAPQPAGL